MTEFIRQYVELMIVLSICLYLTPKESYRSYVRFYIGVLVIVVLITPAAQRILDWDGTDTLREIQRMQEKMEQTIWEERNGLGEEELVEIYEKFLVNDRADAGEMPENGQK